MRKPFEWDRKLLPSLENRVTLCAIGDELIHIQSNTDKQIEKYRRVKGISYPDIALPTRIPSGGTQYDSVRSLSDSNGRTIFEAVGYVIIRIVILLLCTFKTMCLAALYSPIPSRITMKVTSFLSGTADKLKEGCGKVRQENDNRVVKCMSWHPYKPVLAIVHVQDHLFLYDISSEWYFPKPPEGLKHALAKNVTCVSWRPCSSTTLAVGSSSGIVLWKFKLPGGTYEGYNAHQPVLPFLSSECQATAKVIKCLSKDIVGPVSTIAWSPNGYYLAIGSKSHSKLIVWNPSTDETIYLRRIGSGTSHLEWNADGKLLLQSCT